METHLPAITEELLLQYAAASGDHNPIHTSPATATSIGYENVIAHGMLLMGFGGSAIRGWFPGGRLEEFKIKFANITYPGESLICSGKITKQVREGDQEMVFGSFKIVDAAYARTKCLGKFKISRALPVQE